MISVRVISDLDSCRRVWTELIPPENISDLWEVRDCFGRHYNHRRHFIVAEDRDGICGLLPLVWNEEVGSYLYFPGETWSGKTWLEQNRCIARDDAVFRSMMAAVPGRFHLRYLQSPGTTAMEPAIDEVGYLFLPPQCDYDINKYYCSFSGKSLKRLKRETAALESREVEYIIDQYDHFEAMIAMNVDRFGQTSYFGDPRFLRGFRSLRQFLADQGWLRITSVLIGGRLAAIDMGSLYNGTYTLLAGGTSADHPGVAKLINQFHMRWACEQRLERVDFLCGDFNWKTLFHLSPRPLYQLASPEQRFDHHVARSVDSHHLSQSGQSMGSAAHV
ncbi:MAG: GNAT family N-acetyltransferase [bacterium]